MELTVNSGIKSIVIDIENDYCKELSAKDEEKPQYLIELCNYIIQRAKELNLNLVEYNNFRYLVTEYKLI